MRFSLVKKKYIHLYIIVVIVNLNTKTKRVLFAIELVFCEPNAEFFLKILPQLNWHGNSASCAAALKVVGLWVAVAVTMGLMMYDDV